MHGDAFAPQRARCLALLTARGDAGATTDELSDPNVGGHEGPRRVRQLRADGHPVHRARLASGYWRYWLDGSAQRQLEIPWDEED